jgi:hypothetical protein
MASNDEWERNARETEEAWARQRARVNSCIHRLELGSTGLCVACQAECDMDPDAFFEFGQHPQGEANWKALQEEMAAEMASWDDWEPDDSIPF